MFSFVLTASIVAVAAVLRITPGGVRRRPRAAPASTHQPTSHQPTSPAFRKSSYSAQSNCVEVAALPDTVLVRDSQRPLDGALSLTHDQWRQLVATIRCGHFDGPTSSAG